MKRKTNRALRFVVRLSAMLITIGVLAGTCLIPSRVRAKTDPTASFIDRTYDVLLGKRVDGERFGYWYRNLASGSISASGMIDNLTSSMEFTSKKYPKEKTLDLLFELMTGKLPTEESRSTYLNYLENGISIRRVISDLSTAPEFVQLCQEDGIRPGNIDSLELRDKDPQITLFVGRLFREFYGREITTAEANEWCGRFMDGQGAAQLINTMATSPQFASEHSDDEIIDTLLSVMMDRPASQGEKEQYEEMLGNGVSISYVTSQIAKTQDYKNMCAAKGILPGEVVLTQPRDTNYEMTSFLTRLYSRFLGCRPDGEALNEYVLKTIENPSGVRTVIRDLLSAPESEELLSSDDDFLNAVFEVFYGQTPDAGTIDGYRIGLSNGITRARVLSEIMKDPAFDAKMSEYGIDTHIDTEVPEKVIALTFDDGPYTPVTMRILDALEPYGAHATFFVVGNRVGNYSECVIRATNLGCEIGDHTWNHTSLTRLSGDAVATQIRDCADKVYSYTGIRPVVMRPVGGSYNSTVSANVGMPMIIWSIDTNDWKYRDSQHVINEVLNNVRDGDIVLMHDLYETTATAVETIVPALVEAGYTLVTVSELAEYKQTKMESGKAYFSLRG
ncbi:MAG: polysaccharide deacetylase family protein [Clostridiales bacterium]|nr:polysaccharide deacetylase family protein [Clostridiales bacterium]